MTYGNIARVDALVATCRATGSGLPRDTKWGSTVLHLAAHVGGTLAPELTRRMLAAGADPVAASEAGTTPMHMAARFDCGECVALLKDAGAPVMPRDPDGITPLHER
jgi:ankyrin repeat protein